MSDDPGNGKSGDGASKAGDPPGRGPARDQAKGGEDLGEVTLRLSGHRPWAGSSGARDGGGLSKGASGLSALGRAQARAQAFAAQSGPGGPTGPTGPARRDRRPIARLRSATRNRPLGPLGPLVVAARPAHGKRNRSLYPRQRSAIHRALVVSGAVLLAVVVLAGVFVGLQLHRTVPRPVLHLTTATSAPALVPGALPLDWPVGGESAVAVPALGLTRTAGPQTPVPIASLTKVMTAWVVLHDHPLRPGQSGPSTTITAADQAAYQADAAVGDSVAPVYAGETLTELELLEALLVPSADNIGPVIARWDTGSVPALVARMNAMAASLGLHSTHYADETGQSAGSVSTAADQLRLAEVVTASPVLMSIVRMTQILLPAGPPLGNYNGLLGQGGNVGIKTGSTAAAGGCLMFAADRVVGGRTVQLLGVVLGRHSGPLIAAALDAARSLTAPLLAGIAPVTIVPAGRVVARVVPPQGPPVEVTTARAASIVDLPGAPVTVEVTPVARPLASSIPRGTQLVDVTVRAGDQVVTVPAVTDGAITAPSRTWRLERL